MWVLFFKINVFFEISFFGNLGLHKIPVKWEILSETYRKQILLGNDEYSNKTDGFNSLHTKRTNVHYVLNFIRSMDAVKCLTYEEKDLVLPGEFAYNADKQFVNEARMAVRLANFISAFLQVSSVFVYLL